MYSMRERSPPAVAQKVAETRDREVVESTRTPDSGARSKATARNRTQHRTAPKSPERIASPHGSKRTPPRRRFARFERTRNVRCAAHVESSRTSLSLAHRSSAAGSILRTSVTSDRCTHHSPYGTVLHCTALCRTFSWRQHTSCQT